MTSYKSQKKTHLERLKTLEANKLQRFEKSLGLQLDGIAFFLANNSPKIND
jgi:hypothetical protein